MEIFGFPDKVPIRAVLTAVDKLEMEHCYGFPEFWDYLKKALMEGDNERNGYNF